MIVFWIFALLDATSAFAYGLFILGWGLIGAFLFAVASLLVLRGLMSWMRRSLILREKLRDDDNTDKRTIETNRMIFWRRATVVGVLIGLYLGGAGLIFGLPPLEALIVPPRLVGQGPL